MADNQPVDSWEPGTFHVSEADFGRATDVWYRREDGILVGGRFDRLTTKDDLKRARDKVRREAAKLGDAPPGMTRYRIEVPRRPR